MYIFITSSGIISMKSDISPARAGTIYGGGKERGGRMLGAGRIN